MTDRITVDVDGVEWRFAGRIPVNNGLAVGRRNNEVARYTKVQRTKDRLRAKLAAKQN